MNRKYQQTVEVAVVQSTGERIYAPDLLEMDEAAFTALRRKSWESRVLRKQGRDTTPYLVCEICGTELQLTRYRRGSDAEEGRTGNRFFRHDRKAAQLNCPWHDPSRYPPEVLKAMQFHGQKEGRQHRALKEFIVQRLSEDPDAADVMTEKVVWGEVLKGNWRRPDVKCLWKGMPLVFELQLSYTFITEMLGRDLFYQAERKYMLWVFAAPCPGRAVQIDEEYYNRRNLFVLDRVAQDASRQAGKLVLTCHYQVPAMDEHRSRVVNEQRSALVSLDELKFPGDGSFRPFYFDYDAARAAVESQLADERRKRAAIKAASIQLPAAPDRNAGVHGIARSDKREATNGDAPSQPAKEAPDKPRAVIVDAPDDHKLRIFKISLLAATELAAADNGSLLLATDRRSLFEMAAGLSDPVLRQFLRNALSDRGWSDSAQRLQVGVLLRILSFEVNQVLVTAKRTPFELLMDSTHVSATKQKPYWPLYFDAWEVYAPDAEPKQRALARSRAAMIRDGLFDRGREYVKSSEGAQCRILAALVEQLFPQLADACARYRNAQTPLPSRRPANTVFHSLI